MPLGGAFQELIRAAAQLKTTLIKQRPGRQEWENSPPFMRCTAAPTDTVSRAREGGFSIQNSTALQLKEQGNDLINKDPEAALGLYTQAISVFLWFDRGPDRAAEDIPLVCAADKLPESEREQAHHVLAVNFCNAAACLLSLNMAADAAYACTQALRYDPYSVKALYRRALAHRSADTTAGLEAALADLAAANQLEPANNQVRLALHALQHELRELRRKERGLYGNMFQKGGLYDSETATEQVAAAAAAVAAAAAAVDSGTSHGEGWRGGSNEGERPSTSGRDPEDLTFEYLQAPGNRKRSLAAARNRKMAERLDAARAPNAGRFPWWAVPWWAYALIALHLIYRVIKIWRIPVPAPTGGAGAALPKLPQQEVLATPAHGEL
ncbi:hypothetical protein HYH02_014724 [Chlamydomonas schloesseri]|uniref:Peptidylprolyl isomerase n=1 Tax=Chlamydomonas schloesseri TaxID=2026947 RepID=A0A835SJU1_9CHLO|nr:hypothetical protein HYH02_014724 [Chlamydomonas schloesseri]|eukprot:KAG2426871.1 hypothetical protein HYH02_014724 [Chlamydomonas schloesseri]